jgi:hypothetical protein
VVLAQVEGRFRHMTAISDQTVRMGAVEGAADLGALLFPILPARSQMLPRFKLRGIFDTHRPETRVNTGEALNKYELYRAVA